MKRTGNSKKTGKQYTYYCCERVTSKDEANKCDFMTWDVPVADNCPICGDTMFKKAGKGFKKPFCINEKCENFTPEEKRGGWKKKTDDGEADQAQTEANASEPAQKKSAAKTTKTSKSTKTTKSTTKTATKATKTAATSKTTKTTKTAAKKPSAKKASAAQK